MSYQELPEMSQAERKRRWKAADELCDGEDPRTTWNRMKELEAKDRERLRRRICGRIERGEVINGDL